MDIVEVAFAAFAGGILSAIVGWTDSQDTFNGRKFASSAIRALFAGVVFAIGYHFVGSVSIMDIFAAFVGGAGVDVLGNRIAGSIKG
jgi:hypothetical protein